jgi:Ca2+-dependent lipid-binding protein
MKIEDIKSNAFAMPLITTTANVAQVAFDVRFFPEQRADRTIARG